MHQKKGLDPEKDKILRGFFLDSILLNKIKLLPLHHHKR